MQRRIQRYGWDLAADDYEPLWRTQIAVAQAHVLEMADPAPGERVVDVACGTGLVSFAAAQLVGGSGHVTGVDISGLMVERARERAQQRQAGNIAFERMDAEALDMPDGGFDVALCALGLMYTPGAEQALVEMRRVLKPGGRMATAVWGERSRCGWSPVFEIVDAEVLSDVCPLFFRLGSGQVLGRLAAEAGFIDVIERRVPATLAYPDADAACDAAFVGGPVALAWSRFDEATKARVRHRYVEAIAGWRGPSGQYALPGEFVIVSGTAPS
jgi:ubiquinone/menaquinone biosynthesis C-methylase UbiE